MAEISDKHILFLINGFLKMVGAYSDIITLIFEQLLASTYES